MTVLLYLRESIAHAVALLTLALGLRTDLPSEFFYHPMLRSFGYFYPRFLSWTGPVLWQLYFDFISEPSAVLVGAMGLPSHAHFGGLGSGSCSCGLGGV